MQNSSRRSPKRNLPQTPAALCLLVRAVDERKSIMDGRRTNGKREDSSMRACTNQGNHSLAKAVLLHQGSIYVDMFLSRADQLRLQLGRLSNHQVFRCNSEQCMQWNLSTIATLGTEESGRSREVAILARSTLGHQRKKFFICWQRKEIKSVNWRQRLQIWQVY